MQSPSGRDVGAAPAVGPRHGEVQEHLRSGTWDNKTNVQDLTTSYADQTTKIGKVSFTGAITVDLSGRTDLRTIAKSETPYVVTWGSQPNATFTLDAATGKDFKIESDGTGIKIIPRAGITFFIR